MDITSAVASGSLNATASATSTRVSGVVTIGGTNTIRSLTGVNVAYSTRAILANASDAFVLVTSTNTTSASTAWSAGTAQVETATAAGTITASGNATITVTAAGMTGSPKAISVAVTNTDTAATWAGKVRTALAADADVSALFTVGGTTTAISLTRKVNSRGVLPGNDATLNIATANGTCTGITAAATSADTTAGVASDGAYIYDGDAKDFEGVTIPTIATLKAIEIICDHGEVDLTSTDETATIKAGERRTISNDNGMPSFLTTLTFTAVSESDISITVFGATA